MLTRPGAPFVSNREVKLVALALHPADKRLHGESHAAGSDRMRAVALRQAADAHVGIPDRLQLLHAVGDRQFVERGEVFVQQLNQCCRFHGFCEARKSLEIGETEW